MTRAFRAAVSAALVTALMAALHSGAGSAQTTELESGESEKKAVEQAADDLTGTTTAGSTGKAESDATGKAESDATGKAESDATETTPTATEPVSVKPAKKISKPFEPTEKIEAESVISFPANI